MSRADVVIQDAHLEDIRRLVTRPDGVEGAAYLLSGEARIAADPWDRQARRRLLSHSVVPIPVADLISSGPTHVTWSTGSYVRLLRQADEAGLVAGVVHIHPHGPAAFSEQDDRNEAELARMARNRNGDGAGLLSLLLTGDGDLRARLWLGPTKPIPCDTVTVVGRRLAIHDQRPASTDMDDVLARQILAFGPEVIARLRRLKVVIVGCGGTGSATAMLLARLGVGQIILIDDDIVEASNLNRLHLTGRQHADGMQSKAEVLAEEIAKLGLGVRVIALRRWVGHADCRDALRAADVVFGCTDDHDGRMLINRLAYFYLVPVIDMGLVIQPREGGGFNELSGRVTVVTPGATCLLCRGVVDPVTARDEDLRRQNPEEYERRKREAYVRGGGDPAPAVVTFTTETAIMAVNELLAGLTGFRDEGWVWNRTRRFDLLEDRRPGADQDTHCPVCADQAYWGRGDVKPFLDRAG